MSRRALVLLLALLATLACKKPPEKATDGKETAGHDDEKEHGGLPKRVHLTPDVIAAAGIKSARVERRALPSAVDLTGELGPDPDRMAQVAARMAGRIDKVLIQEGALVHAGDLLAVVRAPELGELSSAAQSLAARASSARSNANRLEALLKSGLASQQEVLAAKSEADALESQARAAGERAGAVGAGAAGAALQLRAPISGTILSRHAVVGQPVTAEETLAVVVDLDELIFLARVFEQNLSRVNVGSEAEVHLNAYPDQAFTGKVDYVANQIDPQARTVIARIRLKNRDHILRVGLFGIARIATGEAPNGTPSLLIPRTALAEIGGRTYGFVRHPDNDFELHEIVLGQSALGRVEVLAGLREGEDLVTDGVFTLKSAALKATLAGED